MMTDTTNGYRALPWRSEGYRVFDADGIEVANTFTPELALGSAKAVAKDIVEAANAHYGGKDARIVELEEAAKGYRIAMNDAQEVASLYRKRAEAAEKRAEQAEIDRSELLKYYERYQEAAKAAEKAEARVRELKREYCLTARSVGFGWQIGADQDTFTAPDGRVFRVGQRVYDIVVHEYARVAKAPGGAFPVELQWEDRGVLEPLHADHIGDLRRVWDGLEEPDVPVGTVLRDSYGCYLERLNGTRWEPRWELRDDKGDLIDNDEWINLDGEQFRPYVEVLPGDDE